jgi:hypothetical protein
VPETADHRFALKLLGGILIVWMAGLLVVLTAARLPPEGSGTVIAFFPPRMTSAEAVTASAAAGAKLVSASWFENVLVVADETHGLTERLESQGALAVFRNISFAGVSFAGCVGATVSQP